VASTGPAVLPPVSSVTFPSNTDLGWNRIFSLSDPPRGWARWFSLSRERSVSDQRVSQLLSAVSTPRSRPLTDTHPSIHTAMSAVLSVQWWKTADTVGCIYTWFPERRALERFTRYCYVLSDTTSICIDYKTNTPLCPLFSPFSGGKQRTQWGRLYFAGRRSRARWGRLTSAVLGLPEPMFHCPPSASPIHSSRSQRQGTASAPSSSLPTSLPVPSPLPLDTPFPANRRSLPRRNRPLLPLARGPTGSISLVGERRITVPTGPAEIGHYSRKTAAYPVTNTAQASARTRFRRGRGSGVWLHLASDYAAPTRSRERPKYTKSEQRRSPFKGP